MKHPRKLFDRLLRRADVRDYIVQRADAREAARSGRKSDEGKLGILISIHLFGVIFWIGSLLLIASLLGEVSEEVGVAKERFILVASNLFYRGCNIGGAIALIFGILLMIAEPSVIRQGWLLAKIGLVVILLGVHIRLHRRIVDLSDNPGAVARREFRVIHGLVSALLLAILLLAVIKPF